MIIEVKAKYPIEWNREYYLVGSKEKSVFAPCIACDNKGRVVIKGEEYKCPRCQGNWREKEIVSKIHVFYIEKYKLERIELYQHSINLNETEIRLRFKQSNAGEGYANNVSVRERDFETMAIEERYSYTDERHLIYDLKEAMRQVKAANAAEKAKIEGKL